jgi:hypothetical protein
MPKPGQGGRAAYIEKVLLDEANRIANGLEGGVAALEAELVAIEQRRIETEAELMPADDVDLTLMIREGQNLVGQNDLRIVPCRACHADPVVRGPKSSSRDRGCRPPSWGRDRDWGVPTPSVGRAPKSPHGDRGVPTHSVGRGLEIIVTRSGVSAGGCTTHPREP